MDPAFSLVGITSGTVTLAALALKIGQTLRNIVAAYNQSAAIIYSLIGACQAVEVAWNRINNWVKSQSTAPYATDSAFYEQLATSIEVGKVVLGALQHDLEKHENSKPGQNSLRSMRKVLLDEDVFRDHCTRLTLQLSSLQLLLATASLLVLVTQRYCYELC
jgi:hypothetical protein